MVETYVLKRGKKAFTNLSNSQIDTSVNPVITNDSWTYSGWTVTGYEVREDNTTTFSTGAAAGNRELPSGTSAFTYLSSPINSNSYTMKLPDSITFTMAATHDYFVVIYGTEDTSTDADYIAHRGKIHIAKITQQISMDSENDAFKFSPKLGIDVLENQKFQIYKGPLKTDTNVVAVSYGLLGNSSQGVRYGKTVPMVKGIFYFYEDRLNSKNQLNYASKYTLLKSTLNDASSAATTNSVSYFVTAPDNGARIIEKSKFTYNTKLIDNLKTADSINSTPLSTLVDNTHGSNSTYTPSHDSGWDNIAKNIRRSVSNNGSNLTGPKRYIEYTYSPFKTNSMPYLMDLNIRKNISRTGSFGEIKLVDSTKILNKKINLGDDFIVKELIFEQEIQNNIRALMPGVASKISGTVIRITQLERDDQIQASYSGETSRIITDGSNHGLIRVADYIYMIDSDPIDTFTRDTTNNWWTVDLPIAYYRHINDKFWTAVGTLPSDFTDTNWFREEWSPALSNLKVDFEVHPTLFSLLDINLRGGDFSGSRLKIASADKERKVLTLSDIPSFSYHASGSVSLLSYFTGTSFIDKEIFNGTVEVKNSKIESGGRLVYEIKGRDDISKLLGPLVNKSYNYSNDMVYSTSSPIQNIAASDVKLVSNTSFSSSGIFAGDLGATQFLGTDHSSWERGTKLYTSDGRFIASVKSVVGTAILFEEPARIYYPKTSYIWVSTSNNVISNISMNINKLSTTKPNRLANAISKGMYFKEGKTNSLYGVDTDLYQLHKIENSKSRGYAINSVMGMNADEPYMFRLATEGSTTTYHDIKTISSLTNFDIITSGDDNGVTKIINVAPISPFVLGRADKNSNDTRYSNSLGLYFLNTQSLTSGGLVNLIDSKTHTSENSKRSISISRNENNIFGSPLYKYIDLTRRGNINYVVEILNESTGSYFTDNVVSIINRQYSENVGQGLNYTTAYKFKEGIISNTKVIYPVFSEYSNILAGTLKSSLSDGTQTMLIEPPESRGYLPALGSNFSDFNYYDSSKVGTWPYNTGLTYQMAFDTTNLHTKINGFAYGLYSRDDKGLRTTKTKIAVHADPAYSTNETITWGGVYSSNSVYNYKYKDIANMKVVYEVFDPKALNYHLFGPCDIFNDSFNNVNNIAYSGHSYSFSDFGILGYNAPIISEVAQPQERYEGSGVSTERDANGYNSGSILNSSISPSEMKRFSLGRLTEVVFDLHFNMFDAENISLKRNPIGWLGNADLHYKKRRMVEETPIQITANVSLDDNRVYVSRADWFNNRVTFLSNSSSRAGSLDILFNENAEFIGFVDTTHQGSLKAGTALTITANTTDAAGVDGLTLATTTTGNGDNGLKVVVGESSGAITSVTVSADSDKFGNYYEVGDTITLPTSVIGGSTNVVCTIPANAIDLPYVALRTTGSAIAFNYSAVFQDYTINLDSIRRGAGTTAVAGEKIYAFRFESDSTDDTKKDTQLYPHNMTFELGHFEKSWVPKLASFVINDDAKEIDNRFMMVDFNTEYKRMTPGNIVESNYRNDVNGIKQLMSEKGQYWGDVSNFTVGSHSTDLTFIDMGWGNNIGDNGSSNSFSFSSDYTFPKMYLPFVWSTHPVFNVAGGIFKAMDLETGRILTPLHDTFYYKKDEPSTADFLSEISGEFVALDNESSGSNVAKGVSTITVQDASIYDVGNKIYYFEGGDITKPVFVGIVSSVNTSTEVVTLTSATTVPIPSATPLKTFRSHIMNYWHMSRLFQYMQTNPNDIIKYGLGGKTGKGNYISEGGLYSSGNFVLLKKKQIGKWNNNPANSGTSFSMRYNLEASTYAGFGTGTNILDAVGFTTQNASISSTMGSFYQSDVFTKSYWVSAGGGNYTDTENTVSWGQPIFHTSNAFCPQLYNTNFIKDNGLNGPEDQNVSGTWGFKPQLILQTSTNTTVSAADADFSSSDEFKRIDNADIRKITIDFSTIGLMNAWINFSPNLTGYYLVSNKSSISSLNNAPSVNNMLHNLLNNELRPDDSYSSLDNFTPAYIHQILKHEITYATNGEMVHNIWIDNAVNYDATMVGYRVMRWAENCTYDYSPDVLPIYTLTNKITKHPFEDKMYDEINRIQVGEAVQGEQYQGAFTRKRNEIISGEVDKGISEGTSGTNEGVFSMYVILDSESNNSDYSLIRNVNKFIGQKVTLNESENYYLNDSTNKVDTNVTPLFDNISNTYSLKIGNMIKTKGVVSFGKIFTLTVPSYFDTSKTEKIKIGSTYSIGDSVENIVNDLLETNNIVYEKPSFNSHYYISPDIKGVDLYNALLFVGNYQNYEPIVINKSIKMLDKEDTPEVDITITEGVSRVSLSNKEESMFDIYNKITVYGQGVKGVRVDSASIRELGLRELEEIDDNLTTQLEVDDRASNLLKLYSSNNLQVSMQIDKSGLEYVEVGDTLTIDYESEVPIGKYKILEIHHELGKLPTYSMGKYTTGLDFKIAEVIQANRKVSSAIKGTSFNESVEISSAIEEVKIKELEIHISEYTLSVGSNQTLGFSTPLGFGTTFGFVGNSSSSTKTTLYRSDLT